MTHRGPCQPRTSCDSVILRAGADGEAGAACRPTPSPLEPEPLDPARWEGRAVYIGASDEKLTASCFLLPFFSSLLVLTRHQRLVCGALTRRARGSSAGLPAGRRSHGQHGCSPCACHKEQTRGSPLVPGRDPGSARVCQRPRPRLGSARLGTGPCFPATATAGLGRLVALALSRFLGLGLGWTPGCL